MDGETMESNRTTASKSATTTSDTNRVYTMNTHRIKRNSVGWIEADGHTLD